MKGKIKHNGKTYKYWTEYREGYDLDFASGHIKLFFKETGLLKNKYEYTLYNIFYGICNNDALLDFNKRYPTNKQLEDKLREIIDEYSKDGEIKIKEIIKNINN